MSKRQRKNPVAGFFRAAPWIAGALASAFAWWVLSQRVGDYRWAEDAFPAVAGLAGVLVGFAGTAKSILLALSGSSGAIASLKRKQGYRFLVAHFFDTLVLGLTTAVFSVLQIMAKWLSPLPIALWIGAVVASLVSVVLTAHYLHLLLQSTQDDQ